MDLGRDRRRCSPLLVKIMMGNDDVWRAFNPLWNDIDQTSHFPQKLPLLAHYTSLQTIESILRHEELWLSNPLLMNDLEEVRFGMLNSRSAISESYLIKDAFGTAERYEIFLNSYLDRFKRFEDSEAIDVYILCLSLHEPNDFDGRLSMWRGYGYDGKGAALVFDASKVPTNDGTPFVVAPVQYASTSDRLTWIQQTIIKFSEIVRKTNISNNQIYLASAALFERIYLFSLFTKHIGFKEEEEWRIAYIPNRDANSIAREHISYVHGQNGLEPRLKLNIRKLGEKLQFPLSMDKIVHSVMLGPHASNPISRTMVERMLRSIGQNEIAEKIVSSSIPYRPVGR